MQNKYLSLAAVAGLAASLLIAVPAFAQTSGGVGANIGGNVNVQGGFHNGANGGVRMGGPREGVMPGIFGTVSAVDGTTLTVTAKVWPGMMNATSSESSGVDTYTVDASNATVYKGSATSTVSLSDVNVGDVVMVQGTVSGTNVTATTIRDGVMGTFMGGRRPGGVGGGFGHNGSSTYSSSTRPTSLIQGNGEPVVGGSVTAISGTTLTVTNPGNVTYAIDVSSSTIIKNGTTTTVASIAIGDNLIVQGTVNGTSITASSVIDQGMKAGNASSTNGGGASRGKGGAFFGGFLGAIGGFFQHLFKF